MKIIKLSDIKEEILVCPYCMTEPADDALGCCGESSAHFAYAIVFDDDSTYLYSEVEVLE